MAKFFLLPLLFVAVSMVESYTVVPYPSAAVPVPYGYPVAAPVSAGFRQSSLGPFFGYFPDMFSPPCPVCEVPPVANKAITTCTMGATPPAVSDMSDSPKGTIKLTTAGDTDTCGYALMTTPGYKSITLNCAKAASALQIFPAPSDTFAEGTPISIGAQAYLKFTAASGDKEIDCTWTAVKA